MSKYALRLNNAVYVYVYMPYTDMNDISILNTIKLGNWYHSKIAAALAIRVINFYFTNDKIDVIDTDTLDIVDISAYNKIWDFCWEDEDINRRGFYTPKIDVDEHSDKKFFVLSQVIGTIENLINIDNIFKNETDHFFKRETPVISELQIPHTLNRYYYFYTNDEESLVKYRLCSGNRIFIFDTSKSQS